MAQSHPASPAPMTVRGANITKRRNGAFKCAGRHQNRYVKFATRSSRGATRDVKAPSQFFWDSTAKTFKDDLQFIAEERGGSVTLHVAPLADGMTKSVLTKSQQASFWWTAQHVCKDMLDHGSKDDVEKFFAEVQRHGVCETLLNKFQWHDKVYDERRELSLHKSAVEFVASALGQTIAPIAQQALQLWNSYDGPGAEYPPHKSDTALRASQFGVKPGGGVCDGMRLLLQKGFFVSREFGGRLYYKTPEVERSEKALCAALVEICGRPLNGVSTVAMSSASVGHDAGQAAALRMMHEHHVSVITGLAGTGKSQTTSTFLRGCESSGVIAPSHAAKYVIQDKCRRAGCERAGFEVVQFTKLMGKVRSSDRSIDFLTEMGWVPEQAVGEDRVPEAVQDVAYALVFEEAGMQDLHAIAQTLKVAVDMFPDLCRVVFCGDPRQLRSIDRGNLLQDLIDGGAPHVELTHNWRSGQALARNFRCIVEQRSADITYDDTFQVVECAPQDMTPLRQRAGERGAPKALPLVKIAAEYITDRDGGEEPHIVAYMNVEVNAINDTIVDALGLRPRKGEPFLVKGLKVVVTESVHVPAAAGVTQLQLTKASMYTVQSVRRGCPRTEKVPLLPSPNCSAEALLRRTVDDGVDYFLVTLQTWRGEDVVSCFVAQDDIEHYFEVGYATTIHKMQGAEAQHLYCIAIPNCAYYDCFSLYTNTSRARDRCKCFARKGDMERIISKKARPRVSTLRHMIKDVSSQF